MTDKKWTGKKPLAGREKTTDVLAQLDWTVQPPLGLVKGDYYREEMYFSSHHPGDPGYKGILEVVKKDGRLKHVEYNEITAPSYYIQLYQNVSKKRSSYCFYQATKERTSQSLKVLDNGIYNLEQQMVEDNRLTGDFDLVTGASNSVKRSMLPLAAKVEATSQGESGKKYYAYAKRHPQGLSSRLEVVVEKNKIGACHYDEIFADQADDIKDEQLKKYYRQSKRHCIEYESSYPDGFNTVFDLLEKRVLLSQDLLDLSGLPWTEDSDKRPRNEEWDRYLELAKILLEEMKQDGVLQ